MLQVVALQPSWAQGQPLKEMHHSSWTARDGAPQIITELAQGPDGSLWIGSESGLFNFDGLTFRQYQSPPGQPGFPEGQVYSLLVTKRGTLWVGFYEAGIARISAGTVTLFRAADTEPIVLALDLREATDGSIWATDAQRDLIRFGADGLWHREPSASPDRIRGLFVDSANTLWIAQGGSIYRRPLSQASYARTELASGTGTQFVETAGGSIWVVDLDLTTGVSRLRHVDSTGHLLGSLSSNGAVLGRPVYTSDGSLIVSSPDSGFRRYSAEEMSLPHSAKREPPHDVFTRADGLSANAARAVLVDSHGNIWIGGSRGLDRLRPAMLTRYAPSVEANGWSVCATRQGEVWIANTNGELYSVSQGKRIVFRYQSLYSLACADGGRAWFVNQSGAWTVKFNRVTALPAIEGLPDNRLYKVVAASDGTLFAAMSGPTAGGSAIWHFLGDRWRNLSRQGELGVGGYSAYVDRADRLWIGYTEGRAIRHTLTEAQMFSSGQPGLGTVYAFLDSPRGMLAAGSNGLSVLRPSRFEMLSFAEPAMARGVRGLVEARNGDLWLNGANGFAHVTNNELESALKNPNHKISARLIKEAEFGGALQGIVGYADTAARDADGNLWFSTRSGVVRLNSERSRAPSQPPIVAIRRLAADGQQISSPPVVKAATRTLEIEYVGVNLSAPEKVIYRFRLEGFDPSWRDAGHRTEAAYSRLPPGTYQFSVIASNGDGTWTNPVSTAPITVLPSLYQTRTFAVGMLSLVIAFATTIHWLRVRQIARVMSARFDERLAERTRVARDLHDTMLQTVHGSKLVVDRALRDKTDRDLLVRALEQLSLWLGQAAAEGRVALWSLRASTTETNDLIGAFRRAIDECRIDSGAETPFAVEGSARDLHPMVRDEVYRIGYEAIRNACAHSRASRIEVSLRYSHDLTLRISDNGVGIDASVIERGTEGHFGLLGMRERAGRIGATLKVASGSTTGTSITLMVPGRVAFRSANA